ncbi:hypothetical protein [Streptomyces sp. NPDC088270]|uniref:hypothetical protein n=1 Tax=unclassified Streptomyces TaxID=2593676 RepID=UPI0034421800
MADDLYRRYMQAAAAWRTHLKACVPCRSEEYCHTGAPLYRQLGDLQDAYLRRLRSR